MSTSNSGRVAIRAALAFSLGSALLNSATVSAQSTQFHPLTVKKFSGFYAPNVTTARIDSCLLTATNIIMQDSDGTASNDAACLSQLYRTGSVGTFTATDGNINSPAELGTVFNTPGFVKIVKTITYCGVTGAVAGCTNQTARNGIVITEGGFASAACGKYLAHEYGHSVGFVHTTYNKNVMRQGADTSYTHLFANQCSFYRSNCVDHDGPGGAAPTYGCVSPAIAKGAAADVLDLRGVSIAALAQRGLGDSVPVEAMDVYNEDDAVVLTQMLADPDQAPHHAAVLRLLGLVGDKANRSARELIKYIESGSEDAGALSAAVISLGYVANRGSMKALKYLIKLANSTDSVLADWAVDALGVSGHPRALAHLTRLRSDADLPNARVKRFGRGLDPITHAVSTHASVRARGLRAYYGK